MNNRRISSRTAITALLWVLLTTPLTTLPLLQLADRPTNPLQRWLAGLPYPATVMTVALLLIGPPLLGIVLGLVALRRVNGAWVPRGGAGYARAAIALGIVSMLSGIALLAASIFMA